MTEEKLIDHIISRLEPQILDYVDVRHPQTTSNLQQIIDKYEERFLNRKIRCSSWESRDIKPIQNNCFPNRNRQENWREMRSVADNQRLDGRRRGGQSDHRFHNQGGRQGGSRNSSFRGQNDRNRYLNLRDRCEYGGDRSRCTENPPDTEHQTLRVSSLRMTPVDLPYVPILLNETFITALWDTGAEKSFISEENWHAHKCPHRAKESKGNLSLKVNQFDKDVVSSFFYKEHSASDKVVIMKANVKMAQRPRINDTADNAVATPLQARLVNEDRRQAVATVTQHHDKWTKFM
ncbi:uncharacterized protein TNCV_2368031 [Trichonephila clavipes]|nr:uncharacterized protein TNCV_2368031 [Trichonephila clavipes]